MYYKPKRCVPSNLILLKRKSSISAIDISSHMSVNNILLNNILFTDMQNFIHIPPHFLSQIDIIFTYTGCPLTHLKEKVYLKARVYLWFYCAQNQKLPGKWRVVTRKSPRSEGFKPVHLQQLKGMHPLAGGNFCMCFFMLVVLLFLRQISKGPLVVFISLYHYCTTPISGLS